MLRQRKIGKELRGEAVMEMRMGKYAGGKGWAELTTRDDLLLYHIHILLI